MIRDYILSKYSGSSCKWKPLLTAAFKNPVSTPIQILYFKIPVSGRGRFQEISFLSESCIFINQLEIIVCLNGFISVSVFFKIFTHTQQQKLKHDTDKSCIDLFYISCLF